MKAVSNQVNFGEYLRQLRTERQLPLRTVADKLSIDISMLSKIEHGDRFVQSHMLQPIAELFDLDYRNLQIQYLNQRMHSEFGNEPYFLESIEYYLSNIKEH